MSTQADLQALPTSRKLALGAAALLIINSFLSWYHASVGSISVSQSGWHQLGTIAWIIVIGFVVWEGLRVAKLVGTEPRQADLISAGIGAAALLFALIFVIQRLSDGYLGFAFFLGVILLVVFAYALLQIFNAAGGQEALKAAQEQAAARRAANQNDQDPPAPPSA
ncbi:hypothetical protein [Patulibacter defluvii]|uniref:hypothetical protein n=1 Tax=Patulibacter defluvii TaxID=3095358 RepID=UPI002A753960|nr:hypothetical protein [Patulibacter sp. DM4]